MTIRTWAGAAWRRILGGDASPRRETPDSFSISLDALRLALMDYVSAHDSAMRWTGYSGLAASLWGSLAVTDFSFTSRKFGLDGSQWQLIFVGAAFLSSFRALTGFLAYLRRPTVETLVEDILSRGEVAQEFRAICLLKRRAPDHEYRILVYRDALWECWLLPHYNMANVELRDIDDPSLKDFISAEIGVAPAAVGVQLISGAELKSRKHSEFWRQGTLYRFSFFVVKLEPSAEFPPYLSDGDFVHNGRRFAWLTLSEMEEDPNTRNRNLDVTRHLSDRAAQLLQHPPDSL